MSTTRQTPFHRYQREYRHGRRQTGSRRFGADFQPGRWSRLLPVPCDKGLCSEGLHSDTTS